MLPDEPAQPGNRRFYRRVRNDQWQDETRTALKVTAFTIRSGEAGLSVFDANHASPHNVLEHQLKLWRRAVSDPKCSQKFRIVAEIGLQQCNDSVEGMSNQGWGVVEVTEALFQKYGFLPSKEIDRHGHLEILGTKEGFEEKSLDIIDDPDCRILSVAECRA